jgi:hypothetical protein
MKNHRRAGKLLAVFPFLIGSLFLSTSAFSAPSCDFLSGQASQAIQFYEFIVDQCVESGRSLEACFAQHEMQLILVEDLVNAALHCGQ